MGLWKLFKGYVATAVDLISLYKNEFMFWFKKKRRRMDIKIRMFFIERKEKAKEKKRKKIDMKIEGKSEEKTKEETEEEYEEGDGETIG